MGSLLIIRYTADTSNISESQYLVMYTGDTNGFFIAMFVTELEIKLYCYSQKLAMWLGNNKGNQTLLKTYFITFRRINVVTFQQAVNVQFKTQNYKRLQKSILFASGGMKTFHGMFTFRGSLLN